MSYAYGKNPQPSRLGLLALVLGWEDKTIRREVETLVTELGYPRIVSDLVLLSTADQLHSLWESTREGDEIVERLLAWLTERPWTDDELGGLCSHFADRLKDGPWPDREHSWQDLALLARGPRRHYA